MKKLLLFFMSLNFLVSSGQALSEGFEGTTVPDYALDNWDLGSGQWKVFDNGIGTVQSWREWTVGSLVHSGLRAAYVQREAVGAGLLAEDWLVTPQVFVPADGQLRFYTRKAINTNNGTLYDVRISTVSQTNPTDFIVLDDWNDATINSDQFNPVYEQKVIDLSAYPENTPVYIAFVMTNNNGNRWLVDDVFVDSKCLDPTTQWVTAVNDTSVDLNWDNPSGATEWEIEWGPTGFTQGTGTLVTPVNSNPYTLPGLTAATSYDFYVRSVCPNDNFSAWIGPYTFSTAVCAIADQCDFDFVLTDTWGDGWNGATMQISQFGIPLATIGSTFTAGNGPVTITVPLCSDDPFQVLWSNGGNFPNEVGMTIVDPLGATIFTLPSGSGSQAGSVIFNGIAACTPPTCPQPSNILVSGINTTSGTITWSDNTSGVPVPATQWNVIIQPVGSGYPPSGVEIINTTVSSTSYSFSGLSSDTQYEVYISAICDASGTPDPSFYEGPVVFTTSKDYCNGDIFTDSGGISGNYANSEDITWTICPENAGEAVTVFFNAFNTEANWDGLYVYDGPSIASPQIASANGAGNVPGGVPGSYWGTTIPGPFVSTHPSGCLTFRFRSDTSGIRAGWNANVVCGPPPPCNMPSNLQVLSVTDTSATLGWTDNNSPIATNWNIVVQPVIDGYPTGSSTIIPVTTNPVTIPNLNSNFQYEFYVQSDCGGGDVSYWTGPAAFNTLFAGCSGSAPASDVCVDATPVCSLDGYCGNTSGTYTDASWPALDTAFCGSIENNSFLTFEAASTSISMNVDVGNCTNGSGIQFFVFSSPTCGGTITSLDCYFEMDPGTNALTFNGLVPGNTYFLMIDGFAGAICDYSVTVTSGGSLTTDVELAQDDQTICMDDTLTLDVTGGNGNYTWEPATGLSATTGNMVVFTPPAPGVYIVEVSTNETNSICATADFIEITVLDNTTPSFTNPGPICAGASNVPLDTTDSNGIAGTWTLATVPVTEIDASTQGIYDYVFTPDPVAHACSPVITMQVEILAACTFNSLATAVYIDNCQTVDPGDYFNTTGTSANAFGAVANTFTNEDFGTYVQNSGNLMLKGAALKTFKTTSSNVCSGNMYYRVYEASTAPGTFTTVPLPFAEDCGGTGTFGSGAPCNPGDQIWADLSQSIDLTQNMPGDYILEVYYDFVGDNDDPAQCDDTVLINNGGNNFVANFTIQSAITFAQTNEECGSSNGTIIVSGFNPGDVYSVTYNDDTIPVGPTDYQADFNGDITITGLNAGTYDNFDFVINGCSIFEATPIIITNFSPAIVGVTNNSPICFGNDATFTIEGTPDFEVDYTINGGAVQTVVLDASGFATITIVSPVAGSVDLALLNIHNSVCNIVVSNTSSVVVNPLPTATVVAQNSTVCYVDLDGDSDTPGFGTTVFEISGTPNAVVSYTLNGGAVQTINLDASGNGVVTFDSESDVEIILTEVVNSTTSCSNVLSGVIANVAVVFVPTAIIDTDLLNTCLPTIDDPNTVEDETITTIEVTSPLISQLNYPGDLFISEVTDANGGNINYIEIYNATGGNVDLSNYKLKVEANTNCEVVLSGILANDDTVVVKAGTGAPIAGVAFDFQIVSCTASVNNNDRFLLTNLSDVVIDQWGPSPTDPNLPNGVGYRYARNQTGNILPSTTWNPADWTYTDWVSAANDDYSDMGVYTLYALNYEYILDNGIDTPITQATTTFANITAGTYTLTVHDTATNCYSPYPLIIIINEKESKVATEIEDCAGSAAFAFPIIEGFAYNEFGNNIVDSNDDPVTETISGTWTPSTIDPSAMGVTTYVFTPDSYNSDTGHYYCHDIVEYIVEVKACSIQKGISPNGDGKNDEFDLSAYNVSKLEIFNRYGRKVYGKSNYIDEWHGQSDGGSELPTGTYYYVIEFNDLPAKTGWIYINREE